MQIFHFLCIRWVALSSVLETGLPIRGSRVAMLLYEEVRVSRRQLKSAAAVAMVNRIKYNLMKELESNIRLLEN